MNTQDLKRITIFLLLISLAVALVYGNKIDLDLSVTTPYLLAGEKQTTYLKIGLTGFQLEDNEERTPVNVAIVLDRSGSMDGDKIVRAKEAAQMAVDLLGRDDIVSIITYADTVSVLVHATKVRDRNYIRNRIDSIYADGSTALFAGVSKGADELLKFLDRNMVNRVILLSDGLANVGPDSPSALGDLGSSLGKSGISVTTIGLGLGYNEDLMVRLAEKSDGNHAFVENSRDLSRIFEYEFKDILSVVAQDVEIEINCLPGVIPIRILGRDSEIIGLNVLTKINQLYSAQEKYLLLEVEIDSGEIGTEIELAEVVLRYSNMQSQKTERMSDSINIKFTDSKSKVEENIDAPAMVSAVMQIAAERSEEVVRLRDSGQVEEAKKALESNSLFLRSNAAALQSDELEEYGAGMEADLESIDDDADWNATRKQMVDDQYETQNQQNY